MRIAILTNEYPPHVYGGAGVHVDTSPGNWPAQTRASPGLGHLLRRPGHPRRKPDRAGDRPDFRTALPGPRHKMFQETMLSDLVMAGMLEGVDIVHCHTWYTHLAGCLATQLTGASLVLTTHSLEPHRPWKVEQLGSAYQASSWVERTAYENADGVIAVSGAMREDVHSLYGVPYERMRIIHNGIDLSQYKPTPDPAVLAKYGSIPRGRSSSSSAGSPVRRALFTWSRTQVHPRRASRLCSAPGPRTREEIGREMEQKVEQARREPPVPIIWIAQMLPKEEIIPLYTHASVFVCPSVYEPFGIINLEAMACATPVVASAVGGIKEVVIPGETGLLVPFQAASRIELRAQRTTENLPTTWQPGVNQLLDDPGLPPRDGPAVARARRRILAGPASPAHGRFLRGTAEYPGGPASRPRSPISRHLHRRCPCARRSTVAGPGELDHRGDRRSEVRCAEPRRGRTVRSRS